jgi:hypothetical protein
MNDAAPHTHELLQAFKHSGQPIFLRLPQHSLEKRSRHVMLLLADPLRPIVDLDIPRPYLQNKVERRFHWKHEIPPSRASRVGISCFTSFRPMSTNRRTTIFCLAFKIIGTGGPY